MQKMAKDGLSVFHFQASQHHWQQLSPTLRRLSWTMWTMIWTLTIQTCQAALVKLPQR